MSAGGIILTTKSQTRVASYLLSFDGTWALDYSHRAEKKKKLCGHRSSSSQKGAAAKI
jgi:hypothetical protein